MERVDNQAKGEAPAAGTANRSYRQIREDDPAVKVPARVKAGVAAADRDGAAARDVVAVVIVQLKVNPNKEKTIMPGLNRSGPRGAGPMTGGPVGSADAREVQPTCLFTTAVMATAKEWESDVDSAGDEAVASARPTADFCIHRRMLQAIR